MIISSGIRRAGLSPMKVAHGRITGHAPQICQQAPFHPSFLPRLTGVSAAAFTVGIRSAAAADDTGPPIPAEPFGLGVASGDPTSDGVVLWTRLAPDPLADDGRGGMPDVEVPVHYEVAEDANFARVVRSGTALATPELAHSVHPEVTGLQPGREYFYRFKAGDEISPVGRTKTTPARDTLPDQLRIASASCQAWYHGHFTAYRHMLDEDPDLVLFLGDYIYEYPINDGNLWRAGVELGSEHDVNVSTLPQYRLRYSLFKSDPLLQAAHAGAPWIVTPDDHEVESFYAGDISRSGMPVEEFLQRRAAAYQALYENLPLRSVQRPSGPDLPIYRRVHYGQLAQFDVLDTRQFRDDYPCDQIGDTDCPERYDPERSILGAEQEQWLYSGFATSTAVWNILAQQSVLARIDRNLDGGEPLFSTDQWDGFPANQDRLYAAIAEHGIANPVSLGGDIHRSVTADLKADFTDPDSDTVGVELIATSVASNGDGQERDGFTDLWLANPHVHYYNGHRGYVSTVLTPTELTVELKHVHQIEADTEAPVHTEARYVSEAGNPGLVDA